MGRAVIHAAREAGIRITLLDACYLHGGIGEELTGAQRRFGDGDAESWAARVSSLEGDAGARIGAAIHSVRAVDPDSAATVASWAAERNAPLHAHVSEQPAENEAARRAYGGTPTAVLADADAIGDRFTAVHGTHLAKPTSGSWAQRPPPAACVRPPSVTWPTGSRRRNGCAPRASSWRSVPIPTP